MTSDPAPVVSPPRADGSGETTAAVPAGLSRVIEIADGYLERYR